MGSGDWPKAAGKNPVAWVRSPPSEPGLPSPDTLKVLTNPAPEMVPSVGPFASAAAGSASAARTIAMLRRNMSAPFVVTPPLHRPAGRGSAGTQRRRAVYDPLVVDRPLDEAELVERARRGDLEAWETLVRTYQGIAFRTAYLLAGNAADAEEAAQDGFVKAYRALGRFRRGAELRPWLLRIVANEARNRRRSAGRRERLALRAAADQGIACDAAGGHVGSARRPGVRRPGDAVPSPEAALLAGEERERLLVAVQALPDEHRDAIACRYLLGLSEAETAAAIGVRAGTVKS